MRALADTIAMAFASLRGHVLRSVLTLVGIVIGSATVVATMSLTEGLRIELTEGFSSLGAGAFQAQKMPVMTLAHDRHKYERRPDLTRELGEALRDLPHVAWVSIEEWSPRPEALSTATRTTKANIDVCGGLPDYEHANGVGIARGRFLTETDVQLGRRVMAVGPDVTEVLFPGEDPLGREVRLRGMSFEIVGVTERKGSLLGRSKDAWAVVPWPAFERALGRVRNNYIAIVATTPEDIPRAKEEVIARLRRLRGLAPHEENDFEIVSNETAGQVLDSLARTVGAATLGVCALALLVGGIGVMNIMLVSVTERTREIGVRMALGARRRRILAQFLVESVVLSGLGGVAGVLTGAGLAIAARELWAVPASIPAWAVALSLSSAGAIGLVFGIYPAARASKLDPVEAMRQE